MYGCGLVYLSRSCLANTQAVPRWVQHNSPPRHPHALCLRLTPLHIQHICICARLEGAQRSLQVRHVHMQHKGGVQELLQMSRARKQGGGQCTGTLMDNFWATNIVCSVFLVAQWLHMQFAACREWASPASDGYRFSSFHKPTADHTDSADAKFACARRILAILFRLKVWKTAMWFKLSGSATVAAVGSSRLFALSFNTGSG